MAYVRDEKTGKFKWVQDPADSGAGVLALARRAAPPSAKLLAVGILAVVASIVAWGIGIHRYPSVAIRRIQNHPAEFDGRTVTLRGRMGSVYRVGGSYAYYLLQGGDTIVVFAQGGRPGPGPKAEVRGSISIGYRDGMARPALFATGGQ